MGNLKRPKHRTRSDLPKKYSRKHYNLRHRAKLPFETEHEALAYIKKYECLTGYVAYFCDECGKWHIGKENGKETNNGRNSEL